jgi:hypothetical protein
MNGQQISRILTRTCGETFQGVFPRDRLPTTLKTRPALFILNTDKASGSGEHWIVIWLDADGTGEYFDSLSGAPLKAFKNYLNKHSSHWVANEQQLQSITSRFCGHYAVLYATFRCRGYNMYRFAKMFTPDYGFNDVLAHALVCARTGS